MLKAVRREIVIQYNQNQMKGTDLVLIPELGGWLHCVHTVVACNGCHGNLRGIYCWWVTVAVILLHLQIGNDLTWLPDALSSALE